MNSPVLLVFLLAACCLLSEAHKRTPAERLSDILTGLTPASDLAANVEEVRKHDWEKEPEYRGSSIKEAVNALKKLHLEDPCHFENVKNILVLQKLLSQDEKPSRIQDVVKNYYKDIGECFIRAEEEWNEDPDRAARLEKEFPELTFLGNLLLNYKTISSLSDREIQELYGAIQLFKDSVLKRDKLTREGLKEVLSAIHKLKGNKESLDSITRDEAEKLIEEYLVNPCKQLQKQPELTLFYRIFFWSQFVEAPSQYLRRLPELKSIYWTARWAFCEALTHDLNPKKLAKMISNSRSCLFSCFNSK